MPASASGGGDVTACTPVETGTSVEERVAAFTEERRLTDAMMSLARHEQEMLRRQIEIVGTAERSVSVVANTVVEEMASKKAIADGYASRKLQANAAAIKVAARALMRTEGLRSWMVRWRRAVQARKAAMVAARRMRQRHSLRNFRRVLAAWAVMAAASAGVKRLVATRLAAMHRRRVFASAFHAWRAALEDAKERRRALAKAAQRFQAVWMRVGREALLRWQENTQTKKIIIAATEMAMTSSSQHPSGAADDGLNPEGPRASSTHGSAGDGAQHALVTGVVSAVAGWLVARTGSAGSSLKARQDLRNARKEAAALGAANSACKALRDADAKELVERAAAVEETRRALWVEKEAEKASVTSVTLRAESCEASRSAAAEAHARVVGELHASLEDMNGVVDALERAVADAAVTRLVMPGLDNVLAVLPPLPTVLAPLTSMLPEPAVTLSIEPSVVASTLLCALVLVLVLGGLLVAGLRRRVQKKSEDAGEEAKARSEAAEELELWRESAPKWRAQVAELEMTLKMSKSEHEVEMSALGREKEEALRKCKEDFDAKLRESVEEVRMKVKEELGTAAEVMRKLTAAAEQSEAAATAANAKAEAAIADAEASSAMWREKVEEARLAGAAARAAWLTSPEAEPSITKVQPGTPDRDVAETNARWDRDVPALPTAAVLLTDHDVLRNWRSMCPELQEMWSEAEDHKTWDGVEFDEDGTRVLSLDLSQDGLTGVAPASLGKLTAMVALVLDENKLEDFEADLSGMVSLETLYLSHFPRLTQVPNGITLLSGLRMLGLENCGLIDIPAELANLTGLERLNLGFNVLTSLPKELGQLTALDELLLNDNQLTNLPAELGNLMALQELSLKNNQLTDLPKEVGLLTALHNLSLGGNQLESLPTELGKLVQLNNLSLANNHFSTLPSAGNFPPALVVLELQRNKLAALPSVVLTLSSLQKLDISDNQLSSVPAKLAALPKLNHMDLRHNLSLRSVHNTIGRLKKKIGVWIAWDSGVAVRPVVMSDADALRAWRTDSPQLQALWPEHEDVGNWEGVCKEHVAGSGRVLHISLANKGLTGDLPEELGRLDALLSLDLDCNNIVGLPGWGAIEKMTSLKELKVRSNHLPSVPAVLGSLLSLRSLYLNDNDLANIPETFGGLTALEVLGLAGNRLRDVPAELGNCASLEVLELGRNALHHIPESFGRLTSLKTLLLANNNLEAMPATLGDLGRLTELDLASNRLTDVPGSFVSLSALSKLHLIDNPLHVVPEVVGQLSKRGVHIDVRDGADEGLKGDGNVLRLWRERCFELHTLWPAEDDVTTWEGVTFNERKSRVLMIELPNKDISGEIPAEIGRLDALTRLDLDSNRLTGTVPVEISSLTNLRELDLRGNNLTSLPPEIGRLTLLTGLWLHENQLVSIPEELGRLTALETLNLDNNQLTTIPAKLGNLCKLKALSLGCNQLVNLPSELGKLVSLEELKLRRNNLASLPAEIGMLRCLRELDLRGNNLWNIPASIVSLDTLERLYLTSNRKLRSVPEAIVHLQVRGADVTLDEDVVVEGGDELKSSSHSDVDALHAWRECCPELQEMWPADVEVDMWAGVTWATSLGNDDTPRVVNIKISSKGLTGNVPPEIGQLDALETLDLSGNALTGVCSEIGKLHALRLLDLSGNILVSMPREIGELVALNELNLRRNKLTSVPPEIGKLASLLVLDLRGNKLTALPEQLVYLNDLQKLFLKRNELVRVPKAIDQLRTRGVEVTMDDHVTAEAAPASNGDGNRTRTTVAQEGAESSHSFVIPPDICALLEWREACLELQKCWPGESEVNEDTGFYGVEFGEYDDVDRVVSIKLDDERLTGEIPAAIGRLSALKHLSLGFNQLTNVTPEIGRLTSLETLALHKNQLKSVPDELGNLQSLKMLDLRLNQLSSLPASLAQLATVEIARFSGNMLTSIPTQLNQLASLRKLELKKNPGLKTVPAEISELVNRGVDVITDEGVFVAGGTSTKAVALVRNS